MEAYDAGFSLWHYQLFRQMSSQAETLEALRAGVRPAEYRRARELASHAELMEAADDVDAYQCLRRFATHVEAIEVLSGGTSWVRYLDLRQAGNSHAYSLKAAELPKVSRRQRASKRPS